MRTVYLRSICVAVIILVGSVSAQQSDREKFVDAIRAELAGPEFDRTLAAVEIRDCSSGAVLFEQHATLLLRPASNAKLFPSAAAVLALTEDAGYRTSIFAADSGFRTLIFMGGGDPLLGLKDIQKLAEKAFAAGVTQIDTLITDGSLYDTEFYGAGWMWDDEPDPFMPYLSAFSLERNVLRVTVQAPARTGMPVEVSVHPSGSAIRIENNARSAARGTPSIRKVPRSNRIIIDGKLTAGKHITERFSLWDPQGVAAEQFLTLCRAQGIDTDSTIIIHNRLISETRGIEIAAVWRSIKPILQEMNMESNNLCAESVLRLLARQDARTRGLSTAEGLRAMKRTLRAAGIPTDAVHLRDGSGISFYNLLSAESIGNLLATIATHSSFDRFVRTLSLIHI